ncbi:MAG TPA: ABC transporter permease [Terriglobales bacterium]|nr:ABC transporter permease [Terriglobales bacterium]
METLLQDIRYGLRMLRKNPGFTTVAVLTLALGVGANTAIFSIVNAVLIRPLPYPNANRLVMVWERQAGQAETQNVTSPATFLNWKEQNTVFDQLAACFNGTAILTGGDSPEQLTVQDVSPNLFSMFGVNAALGRTLQDSSDGSPSSGDVVVLSFELWQRRFGSDPGIVGRKITLNGQPNTVVGVMPRGFQFFVKHQSFSQKSPEVWAPLTFSEKARTRHGRYLQAIAELRAGVTLPQAQSAMEGLARTLAAQDPDSMKGWSVNLVPLRQQLVGNIAPALWILLAAVGLVLLIACANVATLLMARGRSRSSEVALRIALGARPRRIVLQMLTESFLLAGFSGVAGLLIARWATSGLLAMAPPDLIPAEGVRLDLPVLGFAALIAMATALLFGMLPALQASRIRPNDQLKEGGRSGTEAGHHGRARSVFVVVELSLSLVLLAGSGLLIRSFSRLVAIDPGFQPQGLLTARVELPASKYSTDPQRSEFFAQVLDRIRHLPGVQSASADAFLPFTGIIAATGVEVEGRPVLPIAEQPVIDVAVVEPHFFDTMGIPLLQGRSFTDREAREVSHKVVISRAMAKKLWPKEDPIGKHVTIHMKREDVPSEVIGVVGDVKHDGLDADVHATAYWPHPELAFSFMTLIARTDGDPLALAPAIRETVRSMDRDQPVVDIASMPELLSISLARARFNTVILAGFASMALLLAVIGTYGVISYGVTERTHEIGVRMALGAEQADILAMVLRQGLALAFAGAAIGVLVAFALSRFLTSLLFGTSPTDPVTYAAVVCLLALVALAASYVPARRATKVDPMTALRYE